MINTVLFDLDGTLLNTLDDLADATNQALLQMGYPVRTLDEIRMFVGNGVAKLIERAVPVGTQHEAIEQTLTIFRAFYAAHSDEKTAPYDGITDMLSALCAAKYRMAVISNKFDAAVKSLNAIYFSNWIPIAIGENEAANIRKKPYPDSVFTAMRQLQSTPDTCIYVGDSDVDIETAKNAGIPCISCTWGFRERVFLLAHGAEESHIIDTPAELVPLLRCFR